MSDNSIKSHILSKDVFYWLAYYFLLLTRLDRIVSDKFYLLLQYRCLQKKKANIKKPKAFNEKLIWLKLYDRRPEYSTMVDKYAVKKYVADIIGEEYIIPTYGVWDEPEEIEWDKLPPQFVLKCTHNSGGLVICTNKSTLDVESAKKKLNEGLHNDYFLTSREWPYKNVQKRIIAEKFMEDECGQKDLIDYKWWCFNGNPTYCQVIQNRSSDETIDFYDTNWIHQDFIGMNTKAHHSSVQTLCPKTLDLQIKIASQLSKNIPFSRIDLYEINGNPYFGEITFYPAGGTGRFFPEEYNEIIGKLLILPQ